jgi:hypothetical protein
MGGAHRMTRIVEDVARRRFDPRSARTAIVFYHSIRAIRRIAVGVEFGSRKQLAPRSPRSV